MIVQFADVKVALECGTHARREKWERDTVVFVEDGELMQSNPRWNNASPIQLDWEDLTAKDWQILPEAA